jgi:hypothetical protein
MAFSAEFSALAVAASTSSDAFWVAGDKIENGTAKAREATGNALVRAGEDVRR